MYIVVAKSDRHPDLFAVSLETLSPFGAPLVFDSREEARAVASSWAGRIADRKMVVRPVSRPRRIIRK